MRIAILFLVLILSIQLLEGQDELVVELDLSSQNLKEIPVDILKRYPALEKLNLSKNKLSSLRGIEECEYLLFLDVSDNKLKDIGKLEELKEITELDLSENFIEKFEFSTDAFPRLSSLNLSGNQLNTWPESTKDLVMLEILNLSYNGIESLKGRSPQFISSLRSLSLRGNKLKELPAWLCQFPLLVDLDLSSNKLSDFNYTCLSKLNQIDLSYNRFGDIPVALTHSRELRELNISFNNLSVLPNWLTQSGIENLDLSANGHLDLYRAFEVLKKSRVKKLILRQLDLVNLPQNAAEMRDLEELDLSANRMELNTINNLSYYLSRTRILH